jgi:ferritin-like protein
MQAAGDIFLGWLTAEGSDGERRHFYVRQLWDAKGPARVDVMTPREMTAYAEISGSTLARAPARSGDRIAIAAYLVRAARSIRRWPTSRRPTQIRTSATTVP